MKIFTSCKEALADAEATIAALEAENERLKRELAGWRDEHGGPGAIVASDRMRAEAERLSKRGAG